MRSSRLPGKVMMKLDNENPILYYLINQLNHCKNINKLIVATTDLQEDKIIEGFSKKIGVKCFRGDANDVLDRYYQCAKKFALSNIVRITSDNPLIDPTLVDEAIKKFQTNDFDYLTNSFPRTFPQGTETEIFTFKALQKAWKEAKKPSEREHVTPYFYNNPNKFRIFNITYSKNLSHLRWTIDRESDLKFVKTIILRIHKRPIIMEDILDLLKKDPKLIEINKDYLLNEGYLISLKNDEEFFKKNRDDKG